MYASTSTGQTVRKYCEGPQLISARPYWATLPTTRLDNHQIHEIVLLGDAYPTGTRRQRSIAFVRFAPLSLSTLRHPGSEPGADSLMIAPEGRILARLIAVIGPLGYGMSQHAPQIAVKMLPASSSQHGRHLSPCPDLSRAWPRLHGRTYFECIVGEVFNDTATTARRHLAPERHLSNPRRRTLDL